MDILEVSLADANPDSMLIEDVTAFKFHLLNAIDHHQVVLFVISKKINDSDSPLQNVSLSYLTCLWASFTMFDY